MTLRLSDQSPQQASFLGEYHGTIMAEVTDWLANGLQIVLGWHQLADLEQQSLTEHDLHRIMRIQANILAQLRYVYEQVEPKVSPVEITEEELLGLIVDLENMDWRDSKVVETFAIAFKAWEIKPRPSKWY